MAKNKNEKIENLFYMSGKNVREKEIENKNKIKERENRIKQNNKLKQKNEFDFETETVIGMATKNNRKNKQEVEKRTNQKQKTIIKKKKRIKFILKILLLMFIVISGIIFALISPIFNIQNIEVINNKQEIQISPDTIISLSGLSKGQNIFKFSKLKSKYSIEKNPYIESVAIKRKIPNKVTIEVKERQKAFNIDFMNKYAYIDNQGYILEISENKIEMPILKGISTPQENIAEGNRLIIEDLEKLETVIKIINICKNHDIDAKITYIDITNSNDYIIYSEQEKKTIYLGDNTNLSNKILWVEAIIQHNQGIEGYIYVNGDLNNNFKPRFREKV